MSRRGEMTAREMGSLGGKARAESTTARQRRRWAGMGGRARAERYSAKELRAFARNAGRRPKLSAGEGRRLLAQVGSGQTHRRLAERFGISLRTVGRIVARTRREV